jgi:hypothetical protein
MGIFKSILGGKIKTGNQFNADYGPDSLHRLLVRAKIRGGSQTANLSDADLKKIEKIITKHAKYIPAGGKFSGYTKYRMKTEIYRLYKKNEISWEDLEDFKRIVSAL